MSEWISVKDKLPDEHDSIFAKFYGTDKWVNPMFRKCSDNVIVAYRGGDGKSSTTMAHTVDGKWKFTVGLLIGEITHWIPLPNPPEV